MKSLMYLIFGLCLLFQFLPGIGFAKTYDVEATGEYVMGDSDTKIEARRLALEHAKRLASEQIGTYLESETVVRDNQLEKDEIRSYTSAILKTTVLSENVNLLSDKTTVFAIKIKANVDTSVLEKKIKEIKGDAKRKEQLGRLQAENIKLLKELEAVSAQLRSSKSTEYKKLREQRESIFERLDKNESSIRVVFEKGTLFSLALKNRDETDNYIKAVDEALQFFADNVKLQIGEPQIRNKGNIADIVVKVDWNFVERYEFFNKLNVFYDMSASSRGIDRVDLYSFRFKGINSEEIYKYFRSKNIKILITVGNRTQFITVIDHYNPSSINLSSKYMTATISNVPIDELNMITSIDARAVVVNSRY